MGADHAGARTPGQAQQPSIRPLQGCAGQPHPLASRRSGSPRTAPPRRSRSVPRWMIPGWRPSLAPDRPGDSRHPVGVPAIRGFLLEPLLHPGIPAGPSAHSLRRDPRPASPPGATGPVRQARQTRMASTTAPQETLSAADPRIRWPRRHE